MVTFRLADALPGTALSAIAASGPSDAERHARLEAFLDAGHGSCALRDPRIAAIVRDALIHFDGRRYRLLAWVITPNHVHLLVETLAGYPLSSLLHTWKTYTALEANKLLGRRGAFWQADYYDRAIRDERHFRSAVEYIHSNPVRAGLVSRPEDWRFSSAASAIPSTGTGREARAPGGTWH